MSYDLVFWNQKSSNHESPSRVFELLLDGGVPSGLATIPVVELLKRLRQVFPGVVEKGGLTFWDGGKRGMFEIHCSEYHFHFCCRQLQAEDMNRLINIAQEFDCRLYDPQVNVRYDGQQTSQ